MGDKTGIEWTDATWSPVVGCSLVSAGCTNCYAMKMAHRLELMGSEKYKGLTRLSGGRPVWTGEARLVPSALALPLRWKRPRRIFVNSMSDLFHESLTNEQIAAVFGVMAAAPQHKFQVLTKRPERAVEWFKWASVWDANGDGHPTEVRNIWKALCCAGAGLPSKWEQDGPPVGEEWPLPNVWLGVSVENQATANERIPLLLKCPAAVRWISAEPLLSPLDLAPWVFNRRTAIRKAMFGPSALNEYQSDAVIAYPLGWVVAGGESGPGARPMHIDWARDLRDQCVAAGVPYLHKQNGAWIDVEDAHSDDSLRRRHANLGVLKNERTVNLAGGYGFHGARPRVMRNVGKHAAGRELDGRTWDEYPEVPR